MPKTKKVVKPKRIKCKFCEAGVSPTRLRKHILEHYWDAEEVYQQADGDMWSLSIFYKKKFGKDIEDEAQ